MLFGRGDSCSRTFAAVFALTLASPASVQAQDEAAFDQGYAAVRAQMQAGKWSEARAALEQLIEKNTGKLYVQAQKDAVVADYRLCSFWCETPIPKATELLSGTVDSWSPATGKVKLRYNSTTMKDWEATESGVLIHPIVFAGAYSISITATSYPRGKSSLRVLLDLAESSGFVADFGFAEMRDNSSFNSVVYLPVSIYQFEQKTQTKLDDRRISPAKGGAPFTAQVKVDKGSIEMFYDRKSLLRVPRPRAEFGQVGINIDNGSEVVLEGTVEPSWFQNLVDTSLASKREAFDERFRVTEKLPKWLFEAPKIEAKTAKHVFDSDHGKSRAARELVVLIAGGKLVEARTALEKLGDADFDQADRDYLMGLCHHRSGNAVAAFPFAEKALAAVPEATYARILQAEILLELNRTKDGLALLQQAVNDDEGNVDATASLFVAQLRRNDTEAATRLVRDAKCKHGLWEEMAPLETMLSMRARGPAWPKRFTCTSAHYRVHSDIDPKVCSEASRVLEESYVNLKAELAWLDDRKEFTKFEVFVFSGESGYQEYCKNILGTPVPHTAGLYSPVLKQLLIWNVPKREDMVRTVRHEGFHQFLDRAMQDPPVWFNEGMAEYWETAKREDGKIQGGQPRPAHIATLTRSKKLLPRLRDFVYGPRADFYANAQLRYAEAWAFVHFLRKGGAANQKLFASLWETLRNGDLGRHGALDKVFGATDWNKLEAEFWTYVQKLDR